jgi:hypothetical protein
MIRRSTWIFFGVFILLIAIVLIWQRYQEQQQAQSTPVSATSYLFELGDNSIVGIAVSNSEKQSVSAKKDSSGKWTLEEPAGQPADSVRIDAAVGTASGLQVLTTLNKAAEFETLGLNPASYQIELTLSDGTRLTAFVGALNPTQSGYNVFIQGQSLKIVERYSLEEVLSLFTDPPILQPTPTEGDLILPTEQP